jgi:hypothetical protein
MVRHGSGVLEHAAILEISCDAGRSKRMIADKGLNAGSRCTPADHGMSVRLGQGSCRNPPHTSHAPRAADCAKQRAFGIVGDASSLEILIEINFEIVVARHFVGLAAFFVQAHP